MKEKAYKYRVLLYSPDGKYYGMGHVFADFNLDGILRDDMFITCDNSAEIIGLIEYVQRLR